MGVFISCDWGSTALRLRLVDSDSRQILAEEESPIGIGRVPATIAGLARRRYLEAALTTVVGRLTQSADSTTKGLHIIVSGMASSTLGLWELPYASVPFAMDGRDLVWHRYMAIDEAFDMPLWLVSGMATEHDVIRGEETQLVGIQRVLGDFEEGICIMPGTHAKHVLVRQHKVLDFRTYMTGEIYDVLARHSMLRDTLRIESDRKEIRNSTDFLRGVEDAMSYPLTHALFRVRTNGVFKKMDGYGCKEYLSGLLIGYEMWQALHWEKVGDREVMVLSGRAALTDRYRQAMEFCLQNKGKNWQLIQVDDCTVEAHCYLFNKFVSWK